MLSIIPIRWDEKGSSHLWVFFPKTCNSSLIMSKTADRPEELNPISLTCIPQHFWKDRWIRPSLSQTRKDRGDMVTKCSVGPSGIRDRTGQQWDLAKFESSLEFHVDLLDLTTAPWQCRQTGWEAARKSHSLCYIFVNLNLL